MMEELYAHSLNHNGQWHRLEEHLSEVARLAKRFAAEFGCGNRGKHYYGRRESKA